MTAMARRLRPGSALTCRWSEMAFRRIAVSLYLFG
jgi:hypothetical protein